MAHLQWHKDQLVPPPTPPSPSAAAAAVVASPRATPLAARDIPPGHSDVAFAGCYLALRVKSVVMFHSYEWNITGRGGAGLGGAEAEGEQHWG